MRKFITILACKLIRCVGKAVGKGSSLPGQIALKLYPDILKHITLPKTVIAVTGSNGKTSTVEMIARVLSDCGKTVAWNKEGSNQIEGVTAMILNGCTLGGKMKSDILLIESDERYAKYTFSHFQPTHYIITNLYRDQLTRNGHPLWVYDAIKQSIPKDCTLVLNSDDPLVSKLGAGHGSVKYFGMDRQDFSTEENVGAYDDGKYCPICDGTMKYEYRHYNHIGAFYCEKCGYSKQEPDFRITKAELKQGYLTIDSEHRIELAFKSIYNAYNILACYSICSLVGISGEDISRAISGYVLRNGRIVTFTLGDAKGTLLTSKHENSVSYDQSLKYIADRESDNHVMIIVDAVSRKYFTGETSWLWDIDFGKLGGGHTKHIYLVGRYAPDLAVRFSYTDIPSDIISVIPSVSDAAETVKASDCRELYVVTCFSDKDKLLGLVKITDRSEE